MLPDPLPLTLSGSSISLPRASVNSVTRSHALASSAYVGESADGRAVSVRTSRYVMSNGDEATEVFFYLLNPASATDPFSYGQQLGNGISVTLVSNVYRYESVEDITALRTALDSVLDTRLQALISGEI